MRTGCGSLFQNLLFLLKMTTLLGYSKVGLGLGRYIQDFINFDGFSKPVNHYKIK